MIIIIWISRCTPFPSDVRLGEARVGQLEKALETYHSELQGYVNKIEADAAHHEDIIKAYKHQVIIKYIVLKYTFIICTDGITPI